MRTFHPPVDTIRNIRLSVLFIGLHVRAMRPGCEGAMERHPRLPLQVEETTHGV